MRNVISCFVLALSVCFLLFNPVAFAQAQDAAAVRATIERHYAAIHALDLESVFQHHLPEFTWFASDGRLLMEAGTTEAATRMGANLDFGTANEYMSHFNAQIYGDVAVATFYLIGKHTWDGETKNGIWRVTAVWVRKGDEWKEAHHHESPLMGEIHPQLRDAGFGCCLTRRLSGCAINTHSGNLIEAKRPHRPSPIVMSGTARMSIEQDGRQIELGFKWLATFRKQADGSWKVAADMWSPNHPAPE